MKKIKLFSQAHSIYFQFILSFVILLCSIIFLISDPAKALLPAWHNDGVVKNAIGYLIFCSIASLLAILSNKKTYILFLIMGCCLLTAGPIATIWELVLTITTLAIGYQITDPLAAPLLANSHLGRFSLVYWIGKGVYVLVLSIISFFPINTRVTATFIIIILLFLSSKGLLKALKESLFLLKPLSISRSRCVNYKLSSFFFLLSFLLLLFAAVHPCFDGDAATIHMRVARVILNKGFWNYNVLENLFAVMPLAPQLNFSSIFLVSGVEGIKLEIMIQFLMILALVATGGGFRVTPIGIGLASALCLTPMFVREISSLFIDLTLCGFILASVVLLTSAIRRKSIELTLLSTVCAAGAMASKNFGLILVPFIFLALFLNRTEWSKIDHKNKIRLIAIVFLAIVLGVFFYAVAWFKTGNPVFPFYNGIFKSSYWDCTNFLDRRWIGHLNWNLPWSLTFHSSWFEESSDGSMGLILIFLLVSSISLININKKNYVAGIPLFIGIVYVFAVGFQIQYLRYFLPALLLISVSLGYYLRFFFYKKNWIFFLVTFTCLFTTNFFAMPSSKFFNGILNIPFRNRLSAVCSNGMPSLNFSEETISGHRYVADVLNSSVRSYPTILLLGCSYGAYFNGTTIYTNWSNHFWKIQEQQFIQDVVFSNYLTTNKISYIVLDQSANSDERKMLIPLVKKNATLIAEFCGVELYRVYKQ